MNNLIVSVSPGYSGKIMLFIEKGVLKQQIDISPEYITGSVEALAELFARAGWKQIPLKTDTAQE